MMDDSEILHQTEQDCCLFTAQEEAGSWPASTTVDSDILHEEMWGKSPFLKKKTTQSFSKNLKVFSENVKTYL